MKTKTIDKLIEMCNSGKSAAMNLCEILTVLEKEKQRKEQKKVIVTCTGRNIETFNPVSDKYVIDKQRELISLLEKENKELRERSIFKHDTRDRKIKGIPDVSLEEILNLLKHDKRQESPYEEGLVRVAYELSKLQDKIQAAK